MRNHKNNQKKQQSKQKRKWMMDGLLFKRKVSPVGNDTYL